MGIELWLVVRWAQGKGSSAFIAANAAGQRVVPPALDLPELAQPTPWWVKWAQVTGKLLNVPEPGPTLFPGSVANPGIICIRPLEALLGTEPAKRHPGPRGPA